MRGRYKGCSMNIYGSILPGATKIARSVQDSKLSKEAKQRLKWLDWYFSHDKKVRVTIYYFNLSSDSLTETFN